MPRLSLLSTPVDALRHRRLFLRLTWACVALILLNAAAKRFMMPQMPWADPDTWGYLYPGLSQLLGDGFRHTYGRNFVYPGWVWLLLSWTRDFRAIPIAQHVLGLCSGVLLWMSWRSWRDFVKHSWLPAWADAFLGLGLVAFFELSASAIHYEHQPRPEAIFPFFAILEILLLLEFCRAWFLDGRTKAGSFLAAGAIFDAALLYQLKPSFGLAVGIVAIPILAALAVSRYHTVRGRLALAGACLAAFAAVGVLLILPERALAQKDIMSTLFLPETLLTVHADIIRDQMASDLRNGDCGPYTVAWLGKMYRSLDQEVHRAAAPGEKPYPHLGFNPDYLMYNKTSFCRMLNDELAPPQAAAFCYYLYLRAWEHRPLPMLEKVGRQLGAFYSIHCPAFWPANRLRLERLYRKTLEALAYPNYQEQLARYSPARAYLAESQRLFESKEVFNMPEWMVQANVAGSVTYLPVLVLFLAGFGATALGAFRRRAIDGTGFLLAGALVLLFYSINFGNCLTIAIVHSLDIDRYSYNQVIFSALAEVAALAWLIELALRAIFQARSAPPVQRPTLVPMAAPTAAARLKRVPPPARD